MRIGNQVLGIHRLGGYLQDITVVFFCLKQPNYQTVKAINSNALDNRMEQWFLTFI